MESSQTVSALSLIKWVTRLEFKMHAIIAITHRIFIGRTDESVIYYTLFGGITLDWKKKKKWVKNVIKPSFLRLLISFFQVWLLFLLTALWAKYHYCRKCCSAPTLCCYTRQLTVAGEQSWDHEMWSRRLAKPSKPKSKLDNEWLKNLHTRTYYVLQLQGLLFYHYTIIDILFYFLLTTAKNVYA